MIIFFFKGKNYLSGVLLQDRLQFIENEHTKSAGFLRHDLILVRRCQRFVADWFNVIFNARFSPSGQAIVERIAATCNLQAIAPVSRVNAAFESKIIVQDQIINASHLLFIFNWLNLLLNYLCGFFRLALSQQSTNCMTWQIVLQ